MRKTSIIMDYESVMIHKKTKKNYKIVQYNDEKEIHGPENATMLLKYVFEEILEWTPQMVRDYLTPEVVKWLNLGNAIKEIPFPPELDASQDYFYLAHYLYPSIIKYRKKDAVIDIYLREKRSDKPRFPSKFFRDKEGKDNFEICLRYVLSENFFASTNNDIYKYFSNNKRANEFFASNLLLKPAKLFYSCIQEAVHSVLSEEDSNDLMYYYYTLQAELSKRYVKCEVKELLTDIDKKNLELANQLKELDVEVKPYYEED